LISLTLFIDFKIVPKNIWGGHLSASCPF